MTAFNSIGLPLSIALFPVACSQSGNSHESDEEGMGKKSITAPSEVGNFSVKYTFLDYTISSLLIMLIC